ncbi:MAG: hypothetical protein ABTR07_05820 [Candidatus Competibacter denitrificans]
MNALETELKAYQQLLPKLLAEQGKFALIVGEKLLGTYTAYEDALKRGYEECGIKPFLVKKISAEEQTFFFTRDLGTPCQA